MTARQEIIQGARQFYDDAFPPVPFIPGETPVPVSGKVFDGDDIATLVDSALDFWLTTGRFTAQFEQEFAAFMGTRFCSLTNSGSSANLLALTALTDPSLKDRALHPGDEVITCACGFPTTINPILQNQLVPVFLDVDIPTYNMDVSRLYDAVGPRTKAIMVAHTLGNPFDLDTVMDVAKRRGLWVIEDCCDAVGSRWNGRPVGSFGDLATTSFYPAHHITMGEGGAVLTSNPHLKKLVESFRDWGRDCWCDPGRDNTCGRRFNQQMGDLPPGYDHKYTYSRIGYNLKATDMQAAVGVSQLKKLPAFIARRMINFSFLQSILAGHTGIIMPQALREAGPSWFGFPITVRPPIVRSLLIRALEAQKIATRMLFGGNLLRQPAYQGIPCRVPWPLFHADQVMRDTFWVGVFPGLTPNMLRFMAKTIIEYLEVNGG